MEGLPMLHVEFTKIARRVHKDSTPNSRRWHAELADLTAVVWNYSFCQTRT